MIKRITLEEKRRITRAVYAKHGYHVEHFYPFTAVPLRPARLRFNADDPHRAKRAAEAAIAKAERMNGYDGKKRWRGGGPR